MKGTGNHNRSPQGEPPTNHIAYEQGVEQHLINFMRVVDRAIWENHSRASNLPMILCAADAHHPPFHAITQNINLLRDGIRVDPHALSTDRIRDEAWKIVAPHYQRRIDQIVDAFRTARAQNLASDALETVTQAASTGRVATLLLDATKHIPGYLDPLTGQLQYGSPEQESRLDDVLDETAERVLRMGGQVLVIPPGTMPSNTGIAAIYRY
jgi:hypothetical protein